MDVADQPMDFWRYHPGADRLPVPPPGQRFITLTETERGPFREYLNEVFTGQERHYGQWRVYSSDFHFRVDRVVAKILNGLPLIQWIAAAFPQAALVYLLRHPVPTSLSILRREWGQLAPVFLRDTDFVEQHLGRDRARECAEFLTRATPLQSHILEWGLENLVPLSTPPAKRSWLTVAYEDLITAPLRLSEQLVRHTAMNGAAEIAKVVSRPSRTTVGRSRAAIRGAQSPEHLLERWVDQIDPMEVTDAFDVLRDVLNLHLYQPLEPYPSTGGALDPDGPPPRELK